MLKSSSSCLVARTCAVCLILLSGLTACGDDAKKDDCSDGAVCSGADAGGLLTGGAAGTTAGTTGTAGTAAGSGNTAGTTAVGNTAGTSAAGSGSAAGTASTPPVGKPAMDGSQFASCDPRADMACVEGLACYTADGATPVGYCTKTCTTDADCTALGAAFTCSSLTQGVTTQYCRATCTGLDDDSCPSLMTCREVQGGGFRCLYDEKDLGTGTGTAWQRCAISGDCSGELACYPDPTTTRSAMYEGACVGTCMTDDDCTDLPATGNIKPRCGGGGNCILDCSTTNAGPGGPGGAGAPAADGGALECPDGMQCANLGAGRARCMYVNANGGI